MRRARGVAGRAGLLAWLASFVAHAQVPSPPAPRTATVTFASEPAGLSFYRVTSLVVVKTHHGWEKGNVLVPLCSAPCTMELVPGWNQFSLSLPAEVPQPTPPVLIPPGASQLSGYFESRAGRRAWGWALFVGSVAGGTALLATAFHTHEECTAQGGCSNVTDVKAWQAVASTALFAIGMPIGIVLVFASPDVPHVGVQSAARVGLAPSAALAGRF